MKYDSHLLYCKVLNIFPPELLRPFHSGAVPLTDHSFIFLKPRHQNWRATRFWKFSNSRILIPGMQIPQKIYDSSSWLVFNPPNKCSRHFATAEAFNSRNISRCTFRIYKYIYIYIYIVLNSYNLFSVFSPIRESIKQLCDTWIQVSW